MKAPGDVVGALDTGVVSVRGWPPNVPPDIGLKRGSLDVNGA